MKYDAAAAIADVLAGSQHVVVVQADNPDGDSLGTALALEHILSDQDKQVSLFCSVDMPGYLHYLSGWDRVSNELPNRFDASIIVDASTVTLLEKLQTNGQLGWLASKPCIVLDHHTIVEKPIEFASVTICDDQASSTGELVYHISRQLGWPVSAAAGANLMTAILGDTQGLSNDLARSSTYRVMADLIESGVDRGRLEERRREAGKMPPEIFRYKADLIARTEFTANGRLAHVTVPQTEISTFSPLYNPAPLVQNDMLQTSGVALAIVFKQYDDGKVTAAIRGSYGYPLAAALAEKMGGGGHPYASGFKITDGRPFNEVKSECLAFARELLDNLDKEHSDETLQHTDPTD